MPPSELHIIGVDPGATTGWARLTVYRNSIYGDVPGEILTWDAGQLAGPEDRQVLELCRLIRSVQSLSYRVGPGVVVEDFDIPPHAPTTSRELLSPVRIAAKLGYAQFRGDLGDDPQIVLQGRSIAKSTATDDRLKEWGLYRKGEDHARDAMRHAVTALRRAKAKPAFRDELWRKVI